MFSIIAGRESAHKGLGPISLDLGLKTFYRPRQWRLATKQSRQQIVLCIRGHLLMGSSATLSNGPEMASHAHCHSNNLHFFFFRDSLDLALTPIFRAGPYLKFKWFAGCSTVVGLFVQLLFIQYAFNLVATLVVKVLFPAAERKKANKT